MKYFTEPKPLDIPTNNGQPFRFADLLAQFVWPDPRWRADAQGRKMFAAVVSKLDAPAGAVIALSDEEFEALSRSLMSIDIRPMPGLAAKLVAMINHVLDATSQEPGEP